MIYVYDLTAGLLGHVEQFVKLV